MRYTGRMAAWATILGLVVLMSVGTAVAQDTPTSSPAAGGGEGGGRRGGRGGLFGVALALPGITEEQKAKLEKMQADSRTKMQELRKNAGTGSPGGPEMQKMQEEQKKEIEGVLTDEQKKEFETKAAEMRSRWSAGRMGGTTGTMEKKKPE